jgi:cell cycle sensor histidine kinase DivJ
MKLQASEKSVALTRAMAPKIGELVADKRACKQILLNLLSNAVKFTPAGGAVAVSVRPDGAHVEIAVSDTGIGVSPKDLARLGDPFFQAKASYDRPYEGAGLGLSIVRGLVALHGGAIKFESAPNEGAIVTVRLPLDGPRAAKDAAQATKIEVLTRRAQAPCELPPSHDQVKKIA